MSEKYLVVGAGVSGIGACELLRKNGKAVTLYDGNEKLKEDEIREKNNLSDVEIVFGAIEKLNLKDFGIAVISPGIPLDSEIAIALNKSGITIWGEVELAFNYSKGRIVAITGTNGKTTTTALVGDILKTHYEDVRVCGNIGIAYTGMAYNSTEDTVFVVEISSFQLETIIDFKPDITAILNITPDHLNRHHTMDNYISAKKNITINQTESDVCILNYEDEVLRAFGKEVKCRPIYFSSERKLENGAYCENGALYFADDNGTDKIIDVDDLTILGKHNFENAMCGILIGLSMGLSKEEIVTGLKNFKAVEHRIEYVCERKGVKFYNDSKATNTDAAIKGICAMNRPTFLIGGGYDKDATFDEWVECFDGRVKKLLLIGETKMQIGDTCKKAGFTDFEYADTLEDAMDICFEEAVSGDAILLSPACASWDMFVNYEERGKCFKTHAGDYKDS